jgi:hypothetical protein
VYPRRAVLSCRVWAAFPRGGLALLALWCGWLSADPGWSLELNQAVLVSSPNLSGPEQKALTMLVEEVEKRTGIRWPQSTNWPSADVPVVIAGLEAEAPALAGARLRELDSLPPPRGAEGFRLCVQSQGRPPAVFVLGNDARGLLFGAGRLLRELHMQRGRVSVADNLEVATAPRYALRGHQLGYRPKCNSYDAWDLPVWEQYFRDLAVFGCNAIELIPPRSDDAANSPHFPRPQMEMMQGMSRLADEYGLAVWIWYPAMDRDYSDPKTVESALREWGDVFGRLKRVDAVFVPGGDPGHTEPKVLLAFLEKETQNLHRYHPRAQMWVSPQSFNRAWLEQFLGILRHEQPAWLNGVVFGPQVRVSLPRLRELVPARYPIRHYPDITHSRQCQYPVPDWDVAYAVTEARECINPRPLDEALIFRKTAPATIGFISYSEGCNDDVNKAVWSALGWDPDMDVTNILRQFSRYFIGERYTESFAQGLLGLEQDWRGPLAANEGVERTLTQFRALENSATPADLKNWRFQQALFRAYYDGYTRRRLLFERDLEAQAMACLREAPAKGAGVAMAEARKVLDRVLEKPVALAWRTRIYQLAEALFQSIGMQLSVHLYQAIDVDRGASLDTLDFPLNNRLWLERQFDRIGALTSEPERLQALQGIVEWSNPGPGGFYDDLGNAAQQPHLLRGPGFAEDPGCYASVRVDFEEEPLVERRGEPLASNRRVSWLDHAESLYDTPLQMAYTGLEPKARYKVRVVYAGDDSRRKIRLVANDTLEVHPYLLKPRPIAPVEFPLPAAATREGKLTLSWSAEPGLGGNGRACQVSEVWLLKEP